MTAATTVDARTGTVSNREAAVGTRGPATGPAVGTTVADLLRQRAALPADHPDRAALRARSIEAALPLARVLAGRYQGRGEPFDDLYQVAATALVNAVDHYDPDRQVTFGTYAMPTILGALKRHFRDTTWRVRVPRRIQELAIRLDPARAVLAQHMGRSPDRRDLAAHLHTTEQDIDAATMAWQAYRPGSLDAPSTSNAAGTQPLIDTIGNLDPRLEEVADRHALHKLVAALPARQQRILVMRYVDDMTQTEIAAKVGLSQMHISRLLARTLADLRTGLLGEPARVAPPARRGARPARGRGVTGVARGRGRRPGPDACVPGEQVLH